MFTTLSAMVVACAMLLPNASVFAASYSQELQDAYNWAYSKGVTTMSPIDNANMYGAITRSEMAKMLSVYATEVLGMTPDTTAACTFSDIDSVKGDLHDYIIESCELGIMGQGISAFRPYDTISRAEFGTALSRVLWGSQYEGGTPYYAKHLDALKAAGIMTQIANAESTKEVRGYVMLMLMRSEDNATPSVCEDTDVKVVCAVEAAAGEYDKCPAACRESEDNTPVVVKSGDLAVTAKAAEGRKALVSTGGAVSDLDTLTFKTSEDVTITKVVLERYGYSSAEDVDAVRLEDQDGNVIAEEKSLSKDKATLSIKKDYRNVDGTYNATVVVRLTGNNVGGTVGFKVVDVESTAKNLNLDNYTPYTYDMVTYAGNTVTVDIKGTAKNYNYEEGESYEIARLKVKAGASIIYVKGFTLTNGSGLDMADFLDKLTVKADGEEVSGLKYSVNKDDELVISFDELSIEMNKSKLFIISASFEDFDDYGEGVAYYLARESDINAVEKKTWARLTVTGSYLKDDAIYHGFNGGKIKLANTKLGNIDAAQGSEGIVVAEGTITVTEPISKLGFTVNSDSKAVAALTLFVNGEEFEWKRTNSWAGYDFTFSNVEIAESGKVQFKIDIEDNEEVATWTVKLSKNFNRDAFDWAKYDNSREPVKTGDVAGTISFSNITIQSARATLKNSLTKDVEFLNEETNTKVVFDGTYTAKKALVDLNKFYISWANALSGVDVTYYLYVDGEEVAYTDSYNSWAEEIFDDVRVKAGESVKIRLEAEVEAYGSTGSIENLYLVLGGTDEFGKDVQYAKARVMTIKVKESGSAKIEASASRNTVLRAASNATLAQFTVKSDEEGVKLDELKITVAAGTGATLPGEEEIELLFDGSEEDCTYAGGVFTCTDLALDLPSKVEVNLTAKKTWAFDVTVNSLNNKAQTRKFSKSFEEALVYIEKQENRGDETVFTLWIDADSDVEVSNVVLIASGTTVASYTTEFWDGEELRAINGSTAQYIDTITYDWVIDAEHSGHVSISKTTYNDYFKVWSDYAKVFKAKDD